jgi:hypothetical protein
MARIDELLEQCSPEQVKWVLRRLTSKTDAEAAKAIGISPETVSRWKQTAPLDEAVSLLLKDSVAGAQRILQQALQDAAQVTVDALHDKGARNGLPAAKEIMDRAGMPTVQKQGVDGELEIHVHYDTD